MQGYEPSLKPATTNRAGKNLPENESEKNGNPTHSIEYCEWGRITGLVLEMEQLGE